jgi:hypothetical protein
MQPDAMHWPLTHDSLAAHARPHMPQCSVELVSVAQALPHAVFPAGHTQRPWLHTLPWGQMTPTHAASTQVPP